MDLPTYTNIWRIEKRLYKLYDFRLPMPLPVGQIAVFTAIAVPYVVVLTLLGLPFSHTLFWLYVLPPGVLAWLATRPVLESKRLPELIVSQLRYLGEPRTWCRLVPLQERDEIVVYARVWHRAGAGTAPERKPGPVPAAVVAPAAAVPAPAAAVPEPAAAVPAPAAAVPEPAAAVPAPAAAVPAPAAAVPEPSRAPVPPRKVTVTGQRRPERPLRVVERALNNPAERRPGGWRDHVVMVVPGGHRPGRPDWVQRDRGRARQPIPRASRVVVLGCTVGAGQTATALMTGDLLARLRAEPVVVLDLNPGPGSLTERARNTAVAPGLAVVTGEAVTSLDEDGEDVAHRFELLSARYPLTIVDPGAAAVPRLLPAADLLVLVAPATSDAASALVMTREWLDAHGHGELAGGSITVINGVSAQTTAHAEQAEAVARGRCRAIVRVPWDNHLRNPGAERTSPPAAAAKPGPRALSSDACAAAPAQLSLPTAHAYTALAGLLVTSLAVTAEPRRARL